MAVSQEIADKINADLGDWKPQLPTLKAEAPEEQKATRAQTGTSMGDATARFIKEVTSAGAVGFTRGADFAKALAAGVAMPLIPEQGKAGEVAWQLLRPSEETLSPQTKEAAANPKTLGGRIFNPMAEGVGGIASMPMPGGLARNIIAGMGMGEGAEIGQKMLGGLFNWFDPTLKKTGEATGAILGGGIGSQANVTRVRAMGEAAKQGGGFVANIGPAYKAARSQQAAGDERALWQIFADEFGNLRAKTRGIIQEFTNANIAAAIKRDIYASRAAEEFVRDAKTTGMDEKPWGLGERTMVPALTKIVQERLAKTYGEAVEMSSRASSMQEAIRDAYNRMTPWRVGAKLPATEEGIVASGKAFQAITQAKLDAIVRQEGNVKGAFPPLSSSETHQIGEAAREARDNLARQSYNVASQKYGAAEALFDAEGVTIPSAGVRKDAAEILRDFYSRVDPTKVPPVVRNLMGATTKAGAEGEGIVSRIGSLDEPLSAAPTVESRSKDLTLKEANDLARALNEAASNAKAAENYAAFNRAKEVEGTLLKSIEGSQASDVAKSAYLEARRFWAEEHAPRFMEGMGKALGKERGGVFEGREAVRSEDVMDRFLRDKETGMRDFDRIYGNDPVATQLLGKTVESKFRKNVLDQRTPDAMERNYDAFRREHSAVLERMPALADKMDARMADMRMLQTEKDLELTRYKDLMNADVTKAVGPLQAKTMFQRALADPIKMEQLIRVTGGQKGAQNLVKEVFEQANPFKNGEYDANALHDLLQAGKSSPEKASSMEILFKKAFGEKEGQRQMDTLEAIANFTKREAATNPQNLRPGSLISDAPVKEATGQSLASWLSGYRAMETRATGSTWFTTLGLSRFANAKAQAAVEKAKIKALYDPDTAKAILELAATPQSQPIGKTTAQKIWGDIRLSSGKKLVDHLLDRGFVKAYVGRGMVYGAEKAQEE